MELVSPAGNLEKLQYAYQYGADAAYIGLKKFSLRIKADNFYENEYEKIIELKKKYPQKKLFCALNISFHNQDIQKFLADLDYFHQYPIDSFIIQDIGMVRIIQKHFPNAHLHLSTQANCINKEAVRMYKDLGFKRVVLGREASLKEIREIKDAVPEMELEVFAHGAMCIAYSGRCLMSAYLTSRSANSGFCSHSCRWEYQLSADAKQLAQSGALVLQEKERPGEYFPVFEGDDYTAILSSKDLCMVDHLADMKKAGVDSLKIEGRMKSLYYVAMTTRAYRKAIDELEGKISKQEAVPFINELYNANHREFATGFFYAHEDADKTTSGESDAAYEMVGVISSKLSESESQAVFELARKTEDDFTADLESRHPESRKAREKDLQDHPEKCPNPLLKKDGYSLYSIDCMNKVDTGVELEYVGPDILGIKDTSYDFVSPEDGTLTSWISHGHDFLIYTNCDLQNGYIVRTKNPDFGKKDGRPRNAKLAN